MQLPTSPKLIFEAESDWDESSMAITNNGGSVVSLPGQDRSLEARDERLPTANEHEDIYVPLSPSGSNRSSPAPSEVPSLLRQTIERPIAASFARLGDNPRPSSECNRATKSALSLSQFISKKHLVLGLLSLLAFISSFAVHTSSSDTVDFEALFNVQATVAGTFTSGEGGGTDLAHKIAAAELATSDLVVAVRFSELQSAHRLASDLSEFLAVASETTELLLELDAKAFGTIDSLIRIDEHMLRTIGKVAQQNPVTKFILQLIRKDDSSELVHKKFMELMSIESDALSDLIMLATTTQEKLLGLNARLQNIRDLAHLENITNQDEQEAILSSIWTVLGANKAEIQVFQTNLELLQALHKYTDEAKSHIGQALFNLKTTQAQLKDLRQRAAQPSIVSTAVPIEVHVLAMNEGLRRMKATIMHRA